MDRPRYASDLTDEEWKRLEFHVHLFRRSPKGRKRKIPLREILNALLYLDRTGCQWRLLPHDLPDWRLVHAHFLRWSKSDCLRVLTDVLRRELRLHVARKAEPSAGIIDSQSVKACEFSRVRGYDGGKKITGIKRHIVVDTIGLLLVVVVHSAGIQDREGAKLVLKAMLNRFPRMQLIWADGGYTGLLIDWVKEKLGWVLEIVKRVELHTFKVLPRRWVVERTFAWLTRWRRLNRHYERIPETAEGLVYIAMIKLMIVRLRPT
jgi:putative transposase